MKSLAGLPAAIGNANMDALLLGLLTIAIIYLFPKITKAVPSTLIALIVATITSEYLNLNISKIGALPQGLPEFSFFIPDANALPHVLLAGITLAILGSLDSLLGSVVVDNVTQTKHHSDKELVGQGMGNMVSGLLGGLAGAGATMRTLLNIKSGGRTAISGMIHSLVILVILLGLSEYASLIPLSVLAGILITVGIGIIDYKAFKIFNKSPRTDRIVFILVIVLTVFVDLITAVQMGFLVGCLLFMKNLSDRELTRSGNLVKLVKDEGDSHELAKDVRVIEAEGPLFFGTSESLMNALDDDHTGTKAIIIRMSRVPLIDQTGAYTLADYVNNMKKEKNIEVVISGLPDDPMMVLRNLNIIPDVIQEDSVFHTLSEAIVGVNKKINEDGSIILKPHDFVSKVGG